LALWLVATPALGQEMLELPAGTCTAAAGVLFTEAGVIRLVEVLRDGRRDAAKAETLGRAQAALRQQVLELQTEVKDLRAAEAAQATELAIWKKLDERREADEARLLRGVDVAVKASDRSDKALQACAARVEALEKRQLVGMAATGLVGFLMGLLGALAAGFVH
jgi:hypothetical protein